jgi:predicted RNA-binding Zn-ribbon protein involved in translation (DUF1610 family)
MSKSTTAAIHMACTCGKRLAVRAEDVGKRVKCPACGQILQSPTTGESSLPSAAKASRTDRVPQPPRFWLLEDYIAGKYCAVLLNQDAVTVAERLAKGQAEQIKADFEGGNHAPALGKSAITIPLDAITAVERCVTLFYNQGRIEIAYRKDDESKACGIRGLPDAQGEEVITALCQALGPQWRRTTSRKVEIVWQMVGWCLFLTVMLGLGIAYACHLAGLAVSIPWPAALVGCLILAPLIFFAARHDMLRTAVLCILGLLGLIGGMVGEIGLVVIGVAAAGLLWLPLLSVGMIANVEATTSARHEQTLAPPGQS